MNDIGDAIALGDWPEDPPQAREIAARQAREMPYGMRHGRDLQKRTIDCFQGVITERKFFRELDMTRPGAGALISCLQRQFGTKVWPGPDGLDINVKSTNMGNYERHLVHAYRERYGLQVHYGNKGLHPETEIYVQIIQDGKDFWFVGWATKDEVLNGPHRKHDRNRDLLYIAIPDLHTPITLFDLY